MKVALTAADLTKWVAYGGCRVVGIYGFNQQATDRFVLFFETPTVASNDVPASKGLNFPASTSASYGGNAFGDDGLYLSQLLIAISTVPQKYTAAAPGGGLELTVIVDTEFPVIPSVTIIVGDLTTSVADLQVWSDGLTIPHSLKKLEVANGTGATAYAIIQASDIALTTDSTCHPLKLVDGVTTSLEFGPSGFSPFRNDNNSLKFGCNVRFVVSPHLPYTFIGSTDFMVRAIYDI